VVKDNGVKQPLRTRADELKYLNMSAQTLLNNTMWLCMTLTAVAPLPTSKLRSFIRGSIVMLVAIGGHNLVIQY
jgi:hypothetical protein